MGVSANRWCKLFICATQARPLNPTFPICLARGCLIASVPYTFYLSLIHGKWLFKQFSLTTQTTVSSSRTGRAGGHLSHHDGPRPMANGGHWLIGIEESLHPCYSLGVHPQSIEVHHRQICWSLPQNFRRHDCEDCPVVALFGTGPDKFWKVQIVNFDLARAHICDYPILLHVASPFTYPRSNLNSPQFPG